MRHIKNISLKLSFLVFVIPISILGAIFKTFAIGIGAVADAIALGLMAVFADPEPELPEVFDKPHE